MHKGVFIIIEGCTMISEWYVWTELIDSLGPCMINKSINNFFGLD